MNPSWALTGFGGNTCTYLGVTPMNERGKRHRVEVYVDALGSAADSSDPLANVERPAALTLNEKIGTEEDGMTIANANVEALWNFYDTYFKRKDISVDGNEVDVNPVSNQNTIS